jgi:hypothetical protein
MYGAYQLKYVPSATAAPHEANVDVKKKISMSSTGAAMDMYKKVSERLLHINCWNELKGINSNQYRLFTPDGNIKIGRAEEGDYIRFELTVPHLNGAKRYEWVKIERILCVKFEEKSSTAIRVQPAQDPAKRDIAAADEWYGLTTNTFIVERIGSSVSIAIYPRNKVHETRQPEGFYDKLHRALAGLMAWIGISETKWDTLIDGLLSTE